MANFLLIAISLVLVAAPGESVLENYERELSTIKLLFYPALHSIDESIEIAAGTGGIDFSRRSVKLLIHGWNADSSHISIQSVRNAYLKRNITHVVTADWREIAALPYIIARDLISVVGARICSKLKSLSESANVTAADIHIVGHSLGCHIATHVGRCFEGRIGRMTALDPAGVLFTKFSTDAVSKNDFAFVDVIHTSAGFAGEFEIRGHVDFYPNRGVAPQPGCEALDLVTFTACSHYRAPLYFAESILLPDSMRAHRCDLSSIQLPAHRNCLNGVGAVLMGEHIDRKTRGVFYLETFSSSPYGKEILPA